MKNLNDCKFIGRLGQDVDLRYTAGGSPVAKFSIACGDDYKDKSGTKVEVTNWINIVAFGKLADICGQFLKKGSKVFISGKFVTNKWQDKASGQDRYSTEIIAGDMEMLDSKGDNQQPEQQPSQPQQQSQQQSQQQPQQNQGYQPQQNQGYQPAGPDVGDAFDDDIPF